jgi:HEAT repeat protein
VGITRSSAREVAALLADLESETDAARETAVARLAVIGTRAVAGLLNLLASSHVSTARVGALAALEAVGDPRAADAAFGCLEEDDAAVRGAAAALLRQLLDSTRGAAVLDHLAAIAVDRAKPDGTRLAALDALRPVRGPALNLIWDRLRDDPSPAVRAMVVGHGGRGAVPPAESLEQAAAGTLPDHPDALRQWLEAGGADAPLPTLHRLVQRVRDRERETTDAVRRREWMTARAAAHQVLAARGSTVALYDLKETIESGEPAPVEMLAALTAIGDRTCLEPIAAAYVRDSGQTAGGTRPPDQGTDWWRDHLAAVFRAIAAREKLNERHAVTKRIRTRWPAAADSLLGPARQPTAGPSSV